MRARLSTVSVNPTTDLCLLLSGYPVYNSIVVQEAEACFRGSLAQIDESEHEVSKKWGGIVNKINKRTLNIDISVFWLIICLTTLPCEAA